ncbi:MAG: patatin-like phospholipase family protein [Thiocapsa sp.]|uniref:patatin-like phospholipase family protein n=1 Tax=Thiocapsa sp. TaxID=2024551 RepID=UPI001BCC6D97|nr:patatin-like phospholipase family protein [Thiocapsa sp.]QVL48332.1 MAG: patatin-like phospholipase family protein [Thiocapsa sp.]
MSLRALKHPLRLALLLVPLLGLLIPSPSTQAAGRPTIGLALSGGGARGAAHVGVLKVIERMGIPVDYVAGTSMGAVVGGLYAMGMSPDEIEATIEEIDWTAIFQDEPPRQDRRIHRKLDDNDFLLSARPGVNEEKREVNLVPALIQGHRLDLALRRYTLPARSIHDFDDLKIPFRAVATDAVTGEAVILGSGDLATSIRASMAVPAAFAPVEIGDLLLIDGGLAMNLPVSVVRDMGADIIIAVDVGGPRRDREDINNVLEMLDQVMGLVTWRNTQEEIAKLRGRDVLITPPLGRTVTAADFNKMLEAIAIGERGAQGEEIALAALEVPTARYAAYLQQQRLASEPLPIIDRVRVENRSRLADALITKRLDVPLGAPLDPDALEAQIDRVFDQDNFESVHYRVEQTPEDETELVITATEKSWGTSSLQFGLELSSASGGDSRFNVGAAYTMAPVNALNAEWRTFLQAGEEPGIVTELYQPLDPLERWYVEATAGYFTESLTLFEPEKSDNPSAKYLISRLGGSLEGGRNFGDWGRLGLKYRRFAGDADLRYGDPGMQGYGFDEGSLDLTFYLDTLDSANFPRRGWVGSAFALTSRPEIGASENYDQAGFNLLNARSWGKNTLLTGIRMAGSFGGEEPAQAFYRLGGFLNLSGFNQDELSGGNLGLARAVYMRNLTSGLLSTYAGASLEAGNVWDQRSEIGFDNLRFGSSLFLGADTFIGPIYLGYGYADGGFGALYLMLGRPWNTRAIY